MYAALSELALHFDVCAPESVRAHLSDSPELLRRVVVSIFEKRLALPDGMGLDSCLRSVSFERDSVIMV